MTNFKYLIPLYFVTFISAELISPCPKLFKYDPAGPENDRWYGTITLLSDSELAGVWLRLIFDKPSLQIGNQFGEVRTTDNIEYLIKKPNHKLLPNAPYKFRFFVRYDPNEGVPELKMFRLNARTICPEGGSAPQAEAPSEQWITSSVSSTTSNPVVLSSENLGSQSQSSNTNEFKPSDFSTHISSSTSNKGIPCGRVAYKPTPLISHGQNTTQGQWPWHAALYHTQGASLVYTCGGSLVSENHVLTAAHCVTKPRTSRPIDADRLTVYLGKYNLKTFGPYIQDVEISEIFVHPDYNSANLFNDVAVLKFKNSIDFTDFIRPVCLWEGDNDIAAVTDKLGTVVGWGFDENRKISEYLAQAQMPIVSTQTCIYSNREFFSQFTFEKTYCAGYRNGTSVCNGDSGGGMVFPKPGTSGRNTVWQIRGLVSVGVALQDELVCDPDHYTIFADVAKHLPWIKQKMRLV